jgi:hypothetical protein
VRAAIHSLKNIAAEVGGDVSSVQSRRCFVATDRIALVNPNDTRIAEMIE